MNPGNGVMVETEASFLRHGVIAPSSGTVLRRGLKDPPILAPELGTGGPAALEGPREESDSDAPFKDFPMDVQALRRLY